MRVGEVVESATFSFGAECYELHLPPPLGGLVKTADGEVDIYGVVCHAATTSLDPARSAIALGRGEEAEEDLYRSHPQLAQLLRTTFQAVVAGHRREGRVYHYLPPRPPRLHSFVHSCTDAEVQEFSRSADFLALVLASPVPGAREEVVAACLRYLSQFQPDPQAFLVAAGKELTLLLRGQGPALSSILRRVRL
ncbi:MAG: hypothetical protein AAB270_04545 [Chloroflexota bacterium]